MAKNSNFDNDATRGIDRTEDDLGFIDNNVEMDESGSMRQDIGANADIATKTATKAKTQQNQQTSLQTKRGNQPDR